MKMPQNPMPHNQDSVQEISQGLKNQNFYEKKFYFSDLMASAVVFIIAIPLSLGIASASGVTATSALISAVIGGIIVGLLSGAPLVVSGPAAGLSSIVLAYTLQYGVQAIALITVLAGACQLIFGGLRMGRLIAMIPKPVLEGTLSAIGLTILLGQIHVLAGQQIPGGPIASFLELGSTFRKAFASSASSGFILPLALTCGVAGLALQILWPRFFSKATWIPAALPATLLVTLGAWILGWEMPRVELAAIGPHLKEALENSLNWPQFFAPSQEVFLAALGLAVVASAESLLTARAIDLLAQKRTIQMGTDLNRELLAQGAGNCIAGFLGGIPMTGVMVRSAANLAAGAKTRLATVLHGLLIALSVLFFAPLMETIPLAVLASILVLTGIKLLNLPAMIRELKTHPKEAWLWPFTASSIIFTDLLKGLIIGILGGCVLYLFERISLRKKQRTLGSTAQETYSRY
jgi:carbonic anhydrase